MLAGPRTVAAIAAAGMLLAVGVSNAADSGGGLTAPRPACFGAAARDPLHPCTNPALRLAVSPAPSLARKLPGAPCASMQRQEGLSVCAFGVPAEQATETVALVGDSHAGHWRAAMDVVARAKGWHGVSITHTSCPLQQARRALPDPGRRVACARWKQDVFTWFAAHPEVSTVFVAGLTGGTGVVASEGRSKFATSVDGYARAWSALLRTASRIVVIRDTPKASSDTNACILRSVGSDVAPGPACARPRADALDHDPAIVAARRLDSPPIRTVDLTSAFCDTDRCYPVIGGALVLRDENHMTAVFSATVGPLLLRAVERALDRVFAALSDPTRRTSSLG